MGLRAQQTAKAREAELIVGELKGGPRPLREEPGSAHAPERPRARCRQHRRPARPAHRGGRPGGKPHRRDPVPDHPDRRADARRGDAGAARDPGQDRGIHRAPGGGRGPAEAHRHPCSQRRLRPPAQRPHHRRRDLARRAGDEHRPDQRQARARGQGAPARDRSGEARAEIDGEGPCRQRAHDARSAWHA